ncbi:MAG: alanine--tRNA ligase [Firmicutes bacterium]|jgi:alanyl-tRNA synthetase|nr:alanine--tRNA ligase [Bacillota bacterium]NLO65214.1 alanine--tRNA ligase [Bacillota bacterium]
MKQYSVDEIRSLFLEFFRSKDHRILPSASLIPHGDPTLLLTVAGMVPFKLNFLGLEKPVHPRIATSQKCIRTADIENVGMTDRHGTFFEMLGNFSFGDYFKAEIIPWAWEFTLEYLKFPEEKLWVSIYQDDDEAYDIWHNKVGVPAERIVRLGKEDNFWETGAGPCGPCSELHIDRGEEFGCGDPDCKPGCECERFLEFWNLVFIQFHQDGDEYTPLKQTGIDTGMGLERVAAILQGKDSIFEVDNFYPIVAKVAEIAKTSYKVDERKDVSLRVIADHLRAVTFLVGDGVLPSNEGRGYVLRRLIRRAIRHGRLLGITDPFANEVIAVVVEQMKAAYPDLLERREYIFRVVSLEEERFNATLEQGMHLLAELTKRAEKEGRTVIAGKDAFQLYDTFGFPIDLTREILADQGFSVDEDGFREAMEAQRERARRSRGDQGYLDSSLEVYTDFAAAVNVEFVGYEQSETEAQLVGIILAGTSVDQAEQGAQVALILDRTPFYAEGGGQIADHGVIITDTGRVRITDVRHPVEGLISHFGTVEEGFVSTGSSAKAVIDRERRAQTARNHTATHLLHRALKDILGEHVNQAGSYVGPDRLRFDFTHFEAVKEEQLEQIEERVNKAILADSAVTSAWTDLETAKEKGAVALFGEQYGEEVRMIQVGDVSLELCGGTHVESTGQIGLFKIVSEGSVAAGVRRIEAVVGSAALEYVRTREGILRQLQDRLQSQVTELPEQVDRLLEENRNLTREISQLKQKGALASLEELIKGAENIGGVSLVVAEVETEDTETLRVLGDRLRDRLDPVALILGSRSGERVLLVSMVSKSLNPHGVHAGKVIKEVAQICGGGGGGRPDMAQAGGRLPDKLPEALAQGKALLREQLEGINL